MKLFIRNVIIFLVPILLVSIATEVLLRKIPNVYVHKKKHLESNANKIETIILGSSHSYFGINPEYFHTWTFNASHISQSLDYDAEILKLYLPQLINLKTVVVPVSYFSLYTSLETGPEAWRVKSYVIYHGLKVANGLSDFSELLSNQPKVTLARLFNHLFDGPTSINCSEFGWGNSYTSNKALNLVETGKSAAKRHTIRDLDDNITKQIFQHNVNALVSIIDLCAKRRIKVLFVTTPTHETYRKHLNSVQLKNTLLTISELTNKHKNCTYLNLHSDSTFKDKDFYDADHLSDLGASKLSLILDWEITNWRSSKF